MALASAIGVIVALILGPGFDNAAAWSGVAGALAVLTAVVSAWSSQRSLEYQEDRLRPYPYPLFDLRSRPGMLQLRLQNFGRTAAHRVYVDWDEQPLDSHGNPVRFGSAGSKIKVLHPQETLATIMGPTHEVMAEQESLDFQGTIHFDDPDGRSYSHRFICSADEYRNMNRFVSEAQEVLHKGKSTPEHIKEIRDELRGIRRVMQDDG